MPKHLEIHQNISHKIKTGVLEPKWPHSPPSALATRISAIGTPTVSFTTFPCLTRKIYRVVGEKKKEKPLRLIVQ